MQKSKVLGLRTTIYKVGNLKEAKNWYAKAFGVEAYFDEPFYIGFNIAGYELGLIPDEKQTFNKSDNVMSYWGVDDIDKAYNHFLKCGAVEHEKPENVGSDIMVAAIKDPWDNVIGLLDNPHFKLPKS